MGSTADPVLDIDPQSFYLAGRRCNDIGVDIDTSLSDAWKTIHGCNSMAGSDDSAKSWADSYDKRASELWQTAHDLVQAVQNYGEIIIQAGYNHALANHDANPQPGPAPEAPQFPKRISELCYVMPPSAGGPGSGLIDDVFGVVGHIGIPVPDGDTHKLQEAHDTWLKLATDIEATDEYFGLAHDYVGNSTAPEIERIQEDIQALRTGAADLTQSCKDLAQSCADRKTALDNLRHKIVQLLEDLAKEVAVQVAIGIAASWITVGLSAAATAIKTAESVKKFAGYIRDAITLWKTEKDVTAAVNETRELGRFRQTIQRLKDLVRRGTKDEPKSPKPTETPVPPEVIAARRDAARDFYLKQGYDPKRIDSHLDGIDFTKPVEVTTIPKGTKVVQYQSPGAPQGNYYAPPGTQPGELGISPQALDRASGNIVDKAPTTYVTTQDVQVLKSSAAQIDDTWSIPGQVVKADGGGTQFMTTSTDAFKPE